MSPDVPSPLSLQELVPRLADLATNLRWTWHAAARDLFVRLDPVLWEASGHTPLAVLHGVTEARLRALAGDAEFLAALEAAEAELRAYLEAETWFQRQHGSEEGFEVVYLCSEFALHESMPQYAGGLGVLAGDHLKSASDLGVPLSAVGLLYRHGYYRQEFLPDGSTRVLYPDADFGSWPLQDTGVRFSCPVGGREVQVRVWRLEVGRVDLYLLDTDLEENAPEDRALTEGLYKGEPGDRLRQQVLLGTGAVRALDALGRRPTVWHLNEGHAAFASLERLARLREEGLGEEEALEAIRQSTVFTTHTPVEAGHDRYEAGEAAAALGPLLERLGWDRNRLQAFARETDAPGDPVCMTVLALRTAGRANGVAALHGEVSRRMWQHLYGAASPEEVPIGHVTNGVHRRTWMDPLMAPFLDRHFAPGWEAEVPVPRWELRGETDPGPELWALRAQLRARLVHFARRRLVEQARRQGESREQIARLWKALDPGALTLGFARRFATYKRAPLIFHDPDRLAALLSAPGRPVQILFAGKAHPRDEKGQEFARRIHQMARRPEFRGRVVILEEYDMHVGRMLTSGCDVWLNTPRRPFEASGTSGMKPPLHGGLNCSIADGWWPEGFDGRNGWMIGDPGEEPDLDEAGAAARDAADAEALYRVLEEEVVPLFYERDEEGLPRGWIERMLDSLLTIPPRFSTHRMVGEYLDGYYLPAFRGSRTQAAAGG